MRNKKSKKNLVMIVSLIGIVVSSIFNFIVWGILGGKSLPYPDPTPELILNQSQAISFYSKLLTLGICITLFFVVVYIIQVVRSRKNDCFHLK